MYIYDGDINKALPSIEYTTVAPKESEIGDFTDVIKVTIDDKTFHFNYNNEIYTENG